MKRPSRFAVLIITLFLVGCGTAIDSEGIAGVYTLVKINDTAIPGTVSHDGVPLGVSSGMFIIHADGTCVSKTVFTPPGGEPTPREVGAKYAVEDSTLTMSWENAGVTIGTVTGDTFVMDNHGLIMEYVRTGRDR